MSVGDDVVDLDDPESRLDTLHPRWAERVFAAAEREALERASLRPLATRPAWSERQRLHWALWAAKESAYKAEKRIDADAVFCPREYVVELSPLPEADGVAAGRVGRRGATFTLELRFDGACLHAVAQRPDGAAAAVLARSGLAHAARAARGPASASGSSGGEAARRLASTTIAAALRVSAGRLRVDGRPPAVLHDGRPTGICLSLSHHGRFVAFAASLGPPPHDARHTPVPAYGPR